MLRMRTERSIVKLSTSATGTRRGCTRPGCWGPPGDDPARGMGGNHHAFGAAPRIEALLPSGTRPRQLAVRSLAKAGVVDT
jgi:hypothetical protein